MKKILVVALVLCGAVLFAKNGNHTGEVKQLDVNIEFSEEKGTTVTNSEGTWFNYYGLSVKEDIVYPPEYWGTYPLYFYGNTIGVTVTVSNLGPRAVAKLKIITEAYVLQEDGTSGDALFEPVERVVEIARGETKVIDGTFVSRLTETSTSGLDRFLVKVLHINEGGGPGNEYPSLIMVKEGVFCPPNH